MPSTMNVKVQIPNIDNLTLGGATGNAKAEESGERKSEQREREPERKARPRKHNAIRGQIHVNIEKMKCVTESSSQHLGPLR